MNGREIGVEGGVGGGVGRIMTEGGRQNAVQISCRMETKKKPNRYKKNRDKTEKRKEEKNLKLDKHQRREKGEDPKKNKHMKGLLLLLQSGHFPSQHLDFAGELIVICLYARNKINRYTMVCPRDRKHRLVSLDEQLTTGRFFFNLINLCHTFAQNLPFAGLQTPVHRQRIPQFIKKLLHLLATFPFCQLV